MTLDRRHANRQYVFKVKVFLEDGSDEFTEELGESSGADVVQTMVKEALLTVFPGDEFELILESYKNTDA